MILSTLLLAAALLPAKPRCIIGALKQNPTRVCGFDENANPVWYELNGLIIYPMSLLEQVDESGNLPISDPPWPPGGFDTGNSLAPKQTIPLSKDPEWPTTYVEQLTPAEQEQLDRIDQERRAAEDSIAHAHHADEECGCYVGHAPQTWKIENGAITYTKSDNN